MQPKLFNPDYLKFLCQKYGLNPSKKYGQNFLIDLEPVEEMVAAAEITKKDVVVEVGPGFGVLTFALAEKAERVIAFEIEKKLEQYWTAHKPENVEIVWGNVLKEFKKGVIATRPVAGKQSLGQSNDCRVAMLLAMTKYKVVANLPYQITSNVIRTFLEADNPPEVMVLMVQKEVAERICAKPGDMSLLSVSVQYYADTEIVCHVPRTLFWPEPTVDSAVIKLSLRAPTSSRGEAIPRVGSAKSRGAESRGIASSLPPVAPRNDFFFKIVKSGFAQRRKFLIKNLEPLAGKGAKNKLKEAFQALGLSEKVRAQELAVPDWINLVEKLGKMTKS